MFFYNQLGQVRLGYLVKVLNLSFYVTEMCCFPSRDAPTTISLADCDLQFLSKCKKHNWEHIIKGNILFFMQKYFQNKSNKVFLSCTAGLCRALDCSGFSPFSFVTSLKCPRLNVWSGLLLEWSASTPTTRQCVAVSLCLDDSGRCIAVS